MRLLSLGLAVLLALLQVPLWIGKGSWLRVWEVDRQLVAQREVNGRLLHRNEALDAEVRDLKTGYEAIEERARAEAILRAAEEAERRDPPVSLVWAR